MVAGGTKQTWDEEELATCAFAFMCICFSIYISSLAILPVAVEIADSHGLRLLLPALCVAEVGRSSAELAILFGMSNFLVKNLFWIFICSSYITCCSRLDFELVGMSSEPSLT